MSRRRATQFGLTLVAALSLAAAPARAQCLSDGELVGLGTALLIVPSEVGALVTADHPRFELGWSGQYPFSDHQRHRFVFGVSWKPGGPREIEGRFGYRYAPGRLFGGLGVALDGEGPAWSPEIGVNLLPRHWNDDDDWLKVHLLVRGQIAPELDRVRGVGVLVGWTLF